MALPYIVDVDYAVARWLNGMAGLHSVLDRFAYTIADSALCKGGLFMAFLWWQWFRRDGDPEHRRSTVIITLAGAVAAIAIGRLLQLTLPFRHRPLHNAELDLTLPVGVDPATLDGWSSFPSDHAVLFFALAAGIWRLNRGLGLAAMLWVAVAICLPRLYLGYHYASDVYAGAVIGFLTMQAAFLLLRPALLAGPLLRWEARHAMSFYFLAFLVSLELAVLFQDLRALASDGFRVVKLFSTGAI